MMRFQALRTLKLVAKRAPAGRAVRLQDDEPNGFVLAEAVVAMTIAALAIGAALIALRQGQMLHVETQKRAQALVLCEEQLRIAMASSKGFGMLEGRSDQNGLKWETTTAPLTQAITLDAKPYVQSSASSSSGRLKLAQITSKVTWRDARRERSLSLQAIASINVDATQ
jgi:hypothetical protein